MTSPAVAPVAAGGRLESAVELRAQGRLQEALAVLHAAGELSPDACTLRGDLEMELGQWREAAGSYSAAVALAGGNTSAQYRLAVCLHQLRQWDAAAEAYRKLLQCEAHRDNARIAMGDCLLHLGRYEAALSCFDACWSDGARAQALFGKAVALQLLGRLEDAEAAYERLVELDPRAEEAFANLIALAAERRDPLCLHRYALRLLELRPESAVALQGLMIAAMERERYDAAAGYYDRLRDARPEAAGSAAGPVTQYRMSPEAPHRLAQHARRRRSE